MTDRTALDAAWEALEDEADDVGEFVTGYVIPLSAIARHRPAIEAEAHSQINVAAIAEALDYIEDEWIESGRLADRLSVKSSWDIAAAVMDRLREQAERGASRSAARPTP